MKLKMKHVALAVATIGALAAGSAQASLTSFQTFVGSDGLSTGGCGTTGPSCSFTSSVPVGSTVLGAYLYSSTWTGGAGGTFNGNAVSYSSLGTNNASLTAYRADVTSIVAPIVASASSSTLTFNVTETNSGGQDGEVLVIVYSNPLLPTQTAAILDGFSATTGDTSAVNFATALHPASPGFVADFRIGDGFSYDNTGCTDSGQVSVIHVNSQTLTNVAGCNDDSVDAVANNGNLITIGGDFDPFTPNVAGGENVTANDHERYNLAPYITDGDTTISLTSFNQSGNDNIFLETFLITGAGSVNAPPPVTGVPEPTSILLMGVGLAGLALRRRKS